MRGETEIAVGDVSVRLRLTLAALAELEAALGVQTITDLVARLVNPSAGQLLTALKILAQHGGCEGVEAVFDGAPINLRSALSALSLLFREVVTDELPGKSAPPANAGARGLPLPSDAAE